MQAKNNANKQVVKQRGKTESKEKWTNIRKKEEKPSKQEWMKHRMKQGSKK